MSEEKKALNDEELENVNGGIFVPSLGLALGIKPTVDNMKQATVANLADKPTVDHAMVYRFGQDSPFSNDNKPTKL